MLITAAQLDNMHVLPLYCPVEVYVKNTMVGCRHIVEFKGVGCMEPHTPETMASTLFIVQEFMSGSTLKVCM